MSGPLYDKLIHRQQTNGHALHSYAHNQMTIFDSQTLLKQHETKNIIMQTMNYISPLCRIIHVKMDGVLMNSGFSTNTEAFNVNSAEESDDWI